MKILVKKVKNYIIQSQINQTQINQNKEDNEDKTLVIDWLKSLKTNPSGKLKNILLKNYKYIDDVTKDNFLMKNRAGKITWIEFKNLIESHYD